MSDNLYASPETARLPPNSKVRFLGTFLKVLGVLGIVLLVAALFLPAYRPAREAARRTECLNNLKQIAMALHQYEHDYDALPPAYTVDASGRPLHSWRTLILPYLDQRELYKSIDLLKPWNDPANLAALKTMPTSYGCPSVKLQAGETTYLAVVGPRCCLNTTKPRSFAEISDGTRNTLMVIEVAKEKAVYWMSPQDANEQSARSFLKDGTLAHTSGSQVAFAEGSVQFLSKDIDPKTLEALITIAGDDVIGDF